MGVLLQWCRVLDLFSSSPVPCVVECLSLLVYFEPGHCQVVVADSSIVFPMMLSPVYAMRTEMFD